MFASGNSLQSPTSYLWVWLHFVALLHPPLHDSVVSQARPFPQRRPLSVFGARLRIWLARLMIARILQDYLSVALKYCTGVHLLETVTCFAGEDRNIFLPLSCTEILNCIIQPLRSTRGAPKKEATKDAMGAQECIGRSCI